MVPLNAWERYYTSTWYIDVPVLYLPSYSKPCTLALHIRGPIRSSTLK